MAKFGSTLFKDVDATAALEPDTVMQLVGVPKVLARGDFYTVGTGSISGTTLTIASTTSGAFRAGMTISGPNVTPLTKAASGTGPYQVTPTQNAALGALTAGAVGVERMLIAATGQGIYPSGEVFYILGEVGYRKWTKATGGSDAANAAASHARTVVLPTGDEIVLSGANADSNRVVPVTTAPSSGAGFISGDYAYNPANKTLYAYSGTWDAGTVLAGAPDLTAVNATIAQIGRPHFSLLIGSDHATPQTWGSTDDVTTTPTFNGYMKMLLDSGIRPYLAVTTSPDVTHAPAGAGGIGWAKLVTMMTAGVEMLSHGHQHVQNWSAMNAGIFINYGGANATATVQISATQIILTGGAGEGATLTRSSYTTINDLIAAINAVGAMWGASIPNATGLTGNEPQAVLLPISGSRNVRGTAAGQSRNFACGGGLYVSAPKSATIGSTVTPAETFWIIQRSNGWLEVYVNGVRVAYINPTTANYTFAQLATDLNAVTDLSSRGITFQYADNDSIATPTFVSYMRGDELAAVLTRSQSIITPNITHPIVLEAGLTQRYMRNRQFQASLDAATANGVTFKGFAEPGNNFAPWHCTGHTQFGAYRGTPFVRDDTGFLTYALGDMSSSPMLPRYSPSTAMLYNSASMVALADAMADCPGHACNILIHTLSIPGGVNGGYDLGTPAGTLGSDQDQANLAAFLARVQTHVASGKIVSRTPSEAVRAAPYTRRPANYVFNPMLRNTGATLPANTTNHVAFLPGWRTTITNVSGATLTVDADGYLVVTSASGVVDVTIEQSIATPADRAFEFGLQVDATGLTGGIGGWIELRRTAYERIPTSRLDVNSGQSFMSSSPLNALGTSGGAWVPKRHAVGQRPIRIVGLQGPYTITAGSNDKFNVGLGAIGITMVAAVTLTPGSRTAQQIADEINAAIDADTNMLAYPEFIGQKFARAERLGRANAALVIQCPEYVDAVTIPVATLTGGNAAAVTLFGGGGGDRYLVNQVASVVAEPGMGAFNFVLRANVQGTLRIGRPYFKPAEVL